MSRRVFFLRARNWRLYLLMRSDFIKEGPSQPSPGLLTQTLQLAAVEGSRLELLGRERRREGGKTGRGDPNEAGQGKKLGVFNKSLCATVNLV